MKRYASSEAKYPVQWTGDTNRRAYHYTSGSVKETAPQAEAPPPSIRRLAAGERMNRLNKSGLKVILLI